MPAQIVTQVMVNEAAEALVAAGQEPTIRTVQARLGAGSYTMIVQLGPLSSPPAAFTVI